MKILFWIVGIMCYLLLAMFADPVIAIVVIFVVIAGAMAIFNDCPGFEDDDHRAMKEHFQKELDNL